MTMARPERPIRLSNSLNRAISPAQRVFSRSVSFGTINYLVAIIIPIFLIFAGFLINLSYLELVRTDLRIATDVAARAAANTWVTTGSRELAVSAAQDAAVRNTVAGKALTLTAEQIEFGTAERPDRLLRYQFRPSKAPWSAVRVTGSRDADSLDGPIALVFPGPVGRRYFEPVVTTVAAQMERDIMLVIDRSPSMQDKLHSSTAAGDSRWQVLETAIHEFLSTLDATPSRENVGLITYTRTPHLEEPLSADYGTLQSSWGSLQPDTSESMGDTSPAIALARETLAQARNARPSAARFILVVTDGDEYAESQLQNSVREAVSDGIVVFTITLDRDANQVAARMVARIGLGRHYHANSGPELHNALRKIASMAPTILAQ